MGVIDIGYGTGDYSTSTVAGYTYVSLDNPANETGSLDTFDCWFATSATGVKMGTFVYAATPTVALNDFESIGDVTAGSKQTFTGKSCSVTAGDMLGLYASTGSIENQGGGTGFTYSAADFFHSGVHDTVVAGGAVYAGYATGFSPVAPTVTTQAASSVSYSTMTGNGTITAGTQPFTERGICYKSGTGQTPTTSDSTVHDHTDATGAFTEALTGLLEVTTYSLRAYAINSTDTAYGSVVEATTLGSPAMTKLYLENSHRRNRMSRKGVSQGITK